MTVGGSSEGITASQARPPELGVVDVAVVMPAMNREGMIRRALQSIQQQTVAPAEVIVVDDASDDATADVAEPLATKVVRLAQRSGSGPARNAGIEAATSTWIAFLDSDDEWEPAHLETLLKEAGTNLLVTAPGRSTGGRVLGNSWGRPIELSPSQLVSPGDLVCTSGTMVKRQALLDAGLFRPLRRAQDLDTWIRILELGPGLALATTSVKYHEHDEQASKDRDLMRQCFDIIMDRAKTQSWCTSQVFDKAYVRWRWDELRSAQRHSDLSGIREALLWFLRRPHTWLVLGKLLRSRRNSRTR